MKIYLKLLLFTLIFLQICTPGQQSPSGGDEWSSGNSEAETATESDGELDEETPFCQIGHCRHARHPKPAWYHVNSARLERELRRIRLAARDAREDPGYSSSSGEETNRESSVTFTYRIAKPCPPQQMLRVSHQKSPDTKH